MTAATQATQTFVPIKEIREGIVVLKDGALRVILMTSSLNFALKSEDEQNAIVMQYQNFLNSLDFSIQFFVQSRKLNVNPYLTTLEEARRAQTNDLMKIQIQEYVEFIRNFVNVTNIVEKTFYVVVPYSSPLILSSAAKTPIGFLGAFFKKSKAPSGTGEDIKFAEAKLQIQQRADVISQGLAASGVRTKQLGTEDLIELFYKLMNPGELEKEALKSIR